MLLTSPPSDPLGDPLRNAWVGCLWPVGRNLLGFAVAVLAALFVVARTGEWLWGLGAFLALEAVNIALWQRAKRREDAARNRLFGLDEDMP